jgi:hypothetical protein
MASDESLRGKLTRGSEDALGKLAQDLLENPLVSGALSRAFEAREKAGRAQEVAMGALNLPSAGDLERLTRRVRSLGQRLEGIEDGVDRVAERLADLQGAPDLAERLDALGTRLDTLTAELRALAVALPGTPSPVSRDQERLDVEDQARISAQEALAPPKPAATAAKPAPARTSRATAAAKPATAPKPRARRAPAAPKRP